MKKSYMAPVVESLNIHSESMLALSLVVGGKADGSIVLSNGREGMEWEEDDWTEEEQ